MATTSNINIDSGSTLSLATNTISEDALTKHIGRSIINDSAGTELGTAAAPFKIDLATIGSGTLAKVNTVSTVSLVANIASIGANVTVVGTINSVSTINSVANIASVGANVTVTGTINSVSTVNTVANISSIGANVTVVGTINSVSTVNTVANISSVGANVTVVGTINSVSTVNTVANITSVGANVTVTGTINTVSTVGTVVSINTVNTISQLAKQTKNYAIMYSAASETTLVPAVASNYIKVFAFSVITNSTGSNLISFKNDASGATVWQVPIGAVFGANLSVPFPSYLFASAAANKPIAVSLASASTAYISVSYWDSDTVL